MQYRLGDGDQFVRGQVWLHDLVPVLDRVSRVQSDRVRDWVNESSRQTDDAAGVQSWNVQDWQFFVPVTVCVSVEQSLFVRTCLKLFPWQTLPAAGVQSVQGRSMDSICCR